MRNLKVLKKSSSVASASVLKTGKLINYPQKQLNVNKKRENRPTTLIQEEIKIAKNLSESLKITQSVKKIEFCDISSIMSGDQESSEDSLNEIRMMMEKPIQKRNLEGLVSTGLKYGVKVVRSLATSPVVIKKTLNDFQSGKKNMKKNSKVI